MMALRPCRECKKQVSTESKNCPSCGAPDPTSGMKTIQQKKRMGLIPKALLVVFGIGLISTFIIPKLKDTTIAATGTKLTGRVADAKVANTGTSSPAKAKIETAIASTRTENLSPEVLADQERFAIGALSALECIEGQLTCTTYDIERHLKRLPIGWVEKALGSPQNEQRLSSGHFYYWTFTLDEGGRKHQYRLQLEYSGGECTPGVNGGIGACKFNFYG